MNEVLGKYAPRPTHIGARLFGAMVTIVFGIVGTACQSTSEGHAANAGGNRVEGQYIVEVEHHRGAPKILEESFSKWQPEAVKRLETDRNLYLVRIADDPGVDDVRQHLADKEGIAGIEPNYRYKSMGRSGSVESE